MRTWLYALVLLPAVAHAGGATEELSAGSAPQAPGSPRAAWISDKLGAIWDPSEDWQLRLDVSGTRDYSAKNATSSDLINSSDILLANLSAEYDPDHWIFRVNASYSPSSTTMSSTTVQYEGPRGGMIDADAALSTKASSASGGAALGYDTQDDDFETIATLSGTVNQFDSLQQISSIVDRQGMMVSNQQIESYCQTHTCSKQLVAALKSEQAQLVQLVLDANIAQSLYRDTDVGIDGQYYVYNQDPTQAGYFSIATAGRTSSFGGGIGIAPMQYAVAPNVVHRMGPVMAMASLSYGHYVDNEGYDVTGMLRLQYKLKLDSGKRLKFYGKVTASNDVDSSHNSIRSGSAALGAQFTW